MIKTPLLEKNLTVLEKKQPLLAKKLRDFIEQREGMGGFSVDEKLSSIGRWIQIGDEDPFFQHDEAEDHGAFRKKHAGSCVFVVNGIGAPPYLFHVLKSLPDTALAVVVVEPSVERLLYTLSMTSVYMALPDGCRISFVVFEDQFLCQEALGVNVKPLGIFLINSAVKINHGGELESLGERFLNLEREMWRQIRLSVEYLGNTAEDTLIGVRNFALNFPWILNSPRFSDFSDLKGRPCICVASGPSLDKNVHLLKDLQDRFVIIAADTAARKLLSLGIIPHFVTSIERPQEMYIRNIAPLIEAYPEECSKIVLVAAFACTPQTVARWPGPVQVIGKVELELDQWLIGALGGGELFPCGASVAHMAVSVALNLGASSIALIGQDLAYGDDGKSHASNTASEKDQAVEAQRYENLLEVPGIYGKPVKTHVTWLKFIKIFEAFTKRCETIGVKIHDCTQGGALIPGSVVEDLDVFVERQAEGISTFAEYPFELAIKGIESKDAPAIANRVQDRLHDSGHPMVQASLDLLKEIEKHVEAVSETITPSQRREHSQRAAVALDRLHGGNSPLAFIGQSYTFLSGAVLAETRNLDTMEEVYRWRRAYEEIIQGHRVILNFFSQWFFYVAKVAYWYGKDQGNRLELLRHIPSDELLVEAEGLLDEFTRLISDEAQEDNTELVRLNNLIARIDDGLFPKEGWEVLWRLSRMLSQQGRGERACRMILAASSRVQGEPLEEAKIVAFLQDLAHTLIKPDLTHIPPFGLALSIARNLADYGQKELSDSLSEEVKGAWHEYLDNLRTSKVIQEKNPVAYFHLLGDLALLEGDFGRALDNVWKVVIEAYYSMDEKGQPLFQWLCRYLDVAFKAEDEGYRAIGDRIVSEIAERPEFLGYYRPVISSALFSKLREKGLNLGVEVSEN
ncbi:MAG: DUF115 domain-containing protein [Dethiosulfovibrio sp.]|nr:DUF115 domain-containing protein [Dethiosulfovibrio sp.]